ncbi:MAG: Glutamine-dependent NAD(+) synthetase [Microgenomates bacterium OLB22]|nr:MAG: Glutamine-dependent NAD(+) synthetase [Microgenomates bacterium OLB22]
MNPYTISLAQLDITPGRPDLNAAKMLQEIHAARERGSDIIIFSEMAVPGYLLGDEWENDSFINDSLSYNEDILAASEGIAVIWGNVYAESDKKGEDGRTRKYNAVFVAQDRKWVSNGVFEGHTFKTLMPKYREFDDERHFYSLAKVSQERDVPISSLLKPFPLQIGEKTHMVGTILCEDMWCEDYPINPTKILVENGAEMIINLSCSPWTWRKNDKRHRVVRSLLKESQVPFVYVNNVGVQNNGKNVFLFDGGSAIYTEDGYLHAMTHDYTEEVLDVQLGRASTATISDPELSDEQDLKEVYDGLVFGLRHFFSTLPTKNVVIGLSGGIDSALSAVLLTAALGKEHVYAVNMPSKFNSHLTKGAAAALAQNLGIHYTIYPIQASIDQTIDELNHLVFTSQDDSKKETPITVTPFITENIQARDRGSRVLSAIAACLNGVFTNNGNKTETALGYATLYGDVNGAIAPLADLYKGEIYALARYINQLKGKDLIPTSIIDVVPSAELSADQDVTQGKGDPIIYPYHDKLLRSFIEFRRDPEYILDLYTKETLEESLKIEAGLVKKHFPTTESFISDLEHKWKLYKINYFKRIQTPPIITVSRRAFGFDLREAQNGIHFTRRYKELKERLL